MGARKCHIIVGAPKEIVAYKIMRLFDVETISLCILDDADTINTTKLIQQHILNAVHGQIVMLASYRFRIHAVANCHFMEFSSPLNTKQYCLNVTDFSEKFEAISTIYNVLVKTKTKGIIFCNVSITFKLEFLSPKL